MTRPTATLLLVDDNPMYRYVVNVALREITDLAITPVFAETIPAALDLFKQARPDIVLLDINLASDTSGLNLLDSFMDLNPNTYVVMMTSHGEAAFVERARQAGAQGYLLKPFTTQKLHEAIRGYLAFCQQGKTSARAPGYQPEPVQPAKPPKTDLSLQEITSSWEVLWVGEPDAAIGGVFKNLGCRIKSAHEGKDGWTYLEKRHFDIMLVDRYLAAGHGRHPPRQPAAPQARRYRDADSDVRGLQR